MDPRWRVVISAPTASELAERPFEGSAGLAGAAGAARALESTAGERIRRLTGRALNQAPPKSFGGGHFERRSGASAARSLT